MATRINRRRVVQTFNPHQNAEGVIPLSFPQRGEPQYQFGPASQLIDGQKNRRNGLDQIQFTIVNPVNGKTVRVFAQCALRDEVKKAYAALEAGQTPTIKNVYGARARADYATGMTTIYAERLTVDYPAQQAEQAPLDIVSAAEMSTSQTGLSVQ